jgi:hypothetical protein
MSDAASKHDLQSKLPSLNVNSPLSSTPPHSEQNSLISSNLWIILFTPLKPSR